MNETTVARNYAEALVTLAKKADDLDGWGNNIEQLASAFREDASLRNFLESPKVSAVERNDVITKAFQDRVPSPFLRFLQALLRNRRQMLIPQIAAEFHNLVDESENRMHIQVTVAREPDDKTVKSIAKELGRMYGKTVVPHVTVNPAILGGMVARIGDTVIDGSVRKRLSTLRGKMLARKSSAEN